MKTLYETISSLSGSESIQAFLSQYVPANPRLAEQLTMLSLAVEGDLMTNALDFFMASRTGSTDGVRVSIQCAVNIEAAWHALLAELNIPDHLMPDFGPPRHSSVEVLLHLGKGEAEPEAVKALTTEFRELLTATQP